MIIYLSFFFWRWPFRFNVPHPQPIYRLFFSSNLPSRISNPVIRSLRSLPKVTPAGIYFQKTPIYNSLILVFHAIPRTKVIFVFRIVKQRFFFFFFFGIRAQGWIKSSKSSGPDHEKGLLRVLFFLAGWTRNNSVKKRTSIKTC